jgi:hypothetical protein
MYHNKTEGDLSSQRYTTELYRHMSNVVDIVYLAIHNLVPQDKSKDAPKIALILIYGVSRVTKSERLVNCVHTESHQCFSSPNATSNLPT